MAYTTINKSTDYFNTITYTGNGTGSTARTVGFDPDWIWVKNRGSDNHYLMDKPRGLDYNLETNNSDAQARDYLISGTTSTGWTSSNSGEINANSANFVAWNWKANGQGSSNTDGSINTTYTSVNTTAGFSISKYTGTGSAATVGHGLGAIPSMIIVKNLTSGSTKWRVYNKSLGATKVIYLNQIEDTDTGSGSWNNTTPTSSVFSVGTSSDTNASGSSMIAYAFADVQGYSKVGGSYTGNGNADGAFIYLGFKPAFVMVKRTDNTGNWYINDNKRDPYNRATHSLFPNLSDAENATGWFVDYVSNGFKIRDSGSEVNASGGTYIYMAFAEAPLVGTNNIPANAR